MWIGDSAQVQQVLRSRLARANDALTTAKWLSQQLPRAPDTYAHLSELLAQLLIDERIKILRIEALSLTANAWELVGLGVSAFLSRETMEATLAEPRPFLLARLFDRALTSAEIFLDLSAISRGNARGGLDLAVEYMQGDWDLGCSIWRGVAAVAYDAYKTHHRGYRINRTVQEGWTAHSQIYVDAGYEARKSFDVRSSDFYGNLAKFGPHRTLFYADPSVAGRRAPGLPTTSAFEYQPPRCGFTFSEQRILQLAAEGLTDNEIAIDLGVSANAIKLAWRSIYFRIQDKITHVLDPAAIETAQGRRGPEKRRRVISFVRDNPQELRPYLGD